MEGTCRHFTLEERRTLFRLLNARLPIKEIASQLGRHRSTIYREIARNEFREVIPASVILDGSVLPSWRWGRELGIRQDFPRLV